jgi:hypothetical protein
VSSFLNNLIYINNIYMSAKRQESGDGDINALWEPLKIVAQTRTGAEGGGGTAGGGGAPAGGGPVQFMSFLGSPAPSVDLATRTEISKTFRNVNEHGFGFSTTSNFGTLKAQVAAESSNKKDIFMFFIQTHGEFEAPLKISKSEGDIPTVRWGRNAGEAIKETRKNQWIIQNSPLGFNGITSLTEDRMVHHMGSNFSSVRNTLIGESAACSPEKLFRNITIGNRRITGVSMFTPPYSLYPDKVFELDDNLAPDSEWDFSMLVIPIFQPMDLYKLQADCAYEEHPDHLAWATYNAENAEAARDLGVQEARMADEAQKVLEAAKANAGGGGGEGDDEEAEDMYCYPWKIYYSGTQEGGGEFDDSKWEYDFEAPGGEQQEWKVTRQDAPVDAGWGFRNQFRSDLLGRLQVNRQIAENDAYWIVGQDNIYWPRNVGGEKQAIPIEGLPSQAKVDELRNNYWKLVCAWEMRILQEGTNRLPPDCPQFAGAPGVALPVDHNPAKGSTYKLSDLMTIFGEGIFIPINCSPAVLVTDTGAVTAGGSSRRMSQRLSDAQIMYGAYYDFVERISKHSLDTWKYICGYDQAIVSKLRDRIKQHVLQIGIDDLPQFLEQKHCAITRLAEAGVRASSNCAWFHYPEQPDYTTAGDDADQPSEAEQMYRQRLNVRPFKSVSKKFLALARNLRGKSFVDKEKPTPRDRWRVTNIKMKVYNQFTGIAVEYKNMTDKSDTMTWFTPITQLLAFASEWHDEQGRPYTVAQSFKMSAKNVETQRARQQDKGGGGGGYIPIKKPIGDMRNAADRARHLKVFGEINVDPSLQELKQSKYEKEYKKRMKAAKAGEQGGGSRYKRRRRRKTRRIRKKTRKRKKSRRKRRKTRRKRRRRRTRRY